MTTLSKCLAVLATVASLAFLGLVSLAAVGGPNYEAEANDPSLADVAVEQKFDETTGEVTWSAKPATPMLVDPKNPASGYKQDTFSKDNKVLAKVLIDAHQFEQKQQKLRLEALDARIKTRKLQIDDAKKTYAADIKAMDARIKELETKLAAKNTELGAIKAKVGKTQDDEKKKRDEAKRRRNDIQRLRNLIVELQADRQRLLAQQRKLEVLLETMQETYRRLQRRNKQLQSRVSNSGGTVAVP